MKQFRRAGGLFLALCALMAALTACGGSGADSGKAEVEYKYPPEFNSTESAKMGAYMAGGYYLMTEEYYYAAYISKLAVIRDHQVKEDKILPLEQEKEEKQEFPEYAHASYLTRGDGEDVYFLTGEGSVVKTTLGSDKFETIIEPEKQKKKNQKDKEKKAPDAVCTLQYQGGRLYYTRGKDKKFYSAKPDGSGETCVLDKECYYPYVFGNRVVYQDDADGESIHLYNLENRKDEKILDGPAYAPNIVGSEIFCEQAKDQLGQVVGVRMRKDGTFEAKAYNRFGNTWYAEMGGMRYVIESHSDPHTGYGTLVFWGKTASGGKVAEEGHFWGALPAYLHRKTGSDADQYSINGTLNFNYSSPYGQVYIDDSGVAVRRYFKQVVEFPGAEKDTAFKVD